MKHPWTPGFNYLLGIGSAEWWQLLRDNRFAIHPLYLDRALLITLASLFNTFSHRREEARFGKEIEAVVVRKPPVFLLGHWRSGTTHLHNLLSLDTESFTYPTTFQAFNPLDFLSNEETSSRLFAPLIPHERPMDGMAYGLRLPQEDEFALSLTTLCSYYLSYSFPKSEAHYARYLTLRDVEPEEVDAWKHALIRFVKKLTLKSDRAVLLKSPPHTARIRLLLEIFPDARFIHIRRHPHAVFQSTCHLWRTSIWYLCLQRPEFDGIQDVILRRYTEMYDAYFEEKERIPKSNLREISFEDLLKDPVAQIQGIYEGFGMQGFNSARISTYVDSLRGYEPNRFPPMAAELQERISSQWTRNFKEWGYEVSA